MHGQFSPAEVVPAAPGVAYALMALGAWLGFMVCWSLRHVWESTFGYGLRWVAKQIRDVGISVGIFGSVHPFGFLADACEALDKLVVHYLAVAALNCEQAAVWSWDHAAQVFVWIGREIYQLTRDTTGALEHFNRVVLPRWFNHAVHYVGRTADSALKRSEAFTRGEVARVEHDARVAEATAIEAAHAAAHALAWAEAEVRQIDKDIARLAGKVASLARGLTVAEVVALIGATIAGLPGIDALRCTGLGALMGKRGCGLWKLVDDLLGLAVAALALESVCEFLPFVEGAFGAVVGPMTHLLTEVPLGSCERVPDTWAMLSVATGPLPPAQKLGTLPG